MEFKTYPARSRSTEKKVADLKKRYSSGQISKAMASSRANVELEGLKVSCGNDKICQKLINGEISSQEATSLILKAHGIR